MNAMTYHLYSVNFDHAAQTFAAFSDAVSAARQRGFDAIITDGKGETIAVWSCVYDLRMVPNKYSA